MTRQERQDALKLIKKLIILIAIMLVVDRTVGSAIEYLYNTKPQGDLKTFSHSINNPKEDIMVYGSSRGVHGYKSSVLTDSLGLTAFNASRENSLILYHSTILNWALKKHKPKIIILDVTPKELSWKGEQDSKTVLVSMLLPYVRRDTAYANMVGELYPRELIKARVSKLYAYNSLILPILLGINWSGKKGADKKNIVNGYLPLYGSKISDTVPPLYDFGNMESDADALEKFEHFVGLAVNNNIKLYVVTCPLYIKPFPETKSLRDIKEVLAKHNIPYWDYASDPRFLRQDYFYDYVHTNDKCATAFTAELSSRIKADILKDSSQNILPRQIN